MYKRRQARSPKRTVGLNRLAFCLGSDMLTFNIHNFSDRVAVGRALDLPVYFGDAGSREVKNNQDLTSL